MIKKILFVDDEEGIVDAAKTALEVYGYEVKTAYSGPECLKKLEGVDLVILDIKMPGMDGIETLKEIKKRKPQLPVVMITAYATVDTAIEAMKQGATDYIRKPFDIEELEKGILAAIEDVKFRKVEDEYTEDCFEKFRKSIKNARGICVTREFDNVLDEGVILISLEEDLKPRSLDKIKEDIEATIEPGDVLLLTNLEYLLKENEMDEVRGFLEWLNKKILANNGKLILSANLKNIDEETREMLQNMIADIHLGLFSASISNYLRRQIISILSDGRKQSFTKLAQKLNIEDNPKLSFHLKKLKDEGVLEQDDEKRYFLSRTGKEIASFIANIKKDKLKNGGEMLWMPFK